jgi:hypothetical protein
MLRSFPLLVVDDTNFEVNVQARRANLRESLLASGEVFP